MDTRSVPDDVGKSTGNFTKIVNSFFDDLRNLSGREAKVALVVFRETAGWQREWAPISLKTFTVMLGCELRATINAIQALETKKRIEVRRLPGKTAEYRLTYAENDTSAQKCTSPEPVQKRAHDPCTFVHEVVHENAHAYKEERNSSKKLKKSSSSSVPPEATKTTSPVTPISQKPEAEAETEPRWWKQYDVRIFQDELNLMKPPQLGYPAVRDVESILADNFEGLDDFSHWTTFVGTLSNARHWSYYLQPARDWKGQRAGYLADLERQRERQREWMERQAAETARIVDITPKPSQQEWCKACAAGEPCEKHGTVPTAPKSRATQEPAHVRHARLSSELAFQREQAEHCRVESLREYAAERARALEAELATIETGAAA